MKIPLKTFFFWLITSVVNYLEKRKCEKHGKIVIVSDQKKTSKHWKNWHHNEFDYEMEFLLLSLLMS